MISRNSNLQTAIREIHFALEDKLTSTRLVNQPAFNGTFNNPGPTIVGLIVSLYEGMGFLKLYLVKD